ncbi:hypothetical protein KAU33_01220 [Candidatus Dependentiae bacterium]|nr:hypothetical protein [Candidatus Dependentiae bacterium]
MKIFTCIGLCFVLFLTMFWMEPEVKYYVSYEVTWDSKVKGKGEIDPENTYYFNYYKIFYDDGEVIRIEDYCLGKLKNRYGGNAPISTFEYLSNNRIKIMCRDKDGNLVRGYYGYVYQIQEVDLKEKTKTEYYYDINGKGVVNSYGNYNTRYYFDDQGRTLKVEFLDKDGNLRELDSGIAMKTYSYDNGTTTLKHFGTDKKIKAKPDGIAQFIIKRNENNQIVEAKFLDVHSKLKNDPEGVAIYKYIWNDKGNLLEIQSYGEDGKLIRHSVAILKSEYNEKNQLIKAYYLDHNRNLNKNGRAIVLHKYNEKGQIIEIRILDYKKELIKEGPAIIERKYNEQGQRIEEIYYNYRKEIIKHDKLD